MSILSALLTMWYSGLQAQCPLACNNLVQVSMDEDCIVQVTPDMMLEGNGLPGSCTYVVQVLNSSGQPLAAPTGINPTTGVAYVGNDWITTANVGQTLTVRVWLGANSCWGTIKIEDKLAPIITCPAAMTIACWDPRTFALPTVTDNCGGNPVVSILSDVTTESECTDPNSRAVRVIRYQAKDASGNLSLVCSRTITYSKITLLDIKFPKNYDGTVGNRPHLGCDGSYDWAVSSASNWDLNGNFYPDPLETGAPYIKDPANVRFVVTGYKVGASPSAFGVANLFGCVAGNIVGSQYAASLVTNAAGVQRPWTVVCDNGSGTPAPIDTLYNEFVGNNTLCKINTTFSDTKIDICAKSFKVLRQWTVLDWCTGGIVQKYQIIKVVDDKGPVATIPTDIPAPAIACVNKVSSVILADPYTCRGTWVALSPINVYDCSKWDYSIAFLLADAAGGPPASGTYVTSNGATSVQQLADVNGRNSYQIVGLPLGCTWIRYAVSDECGNVTYAFTEIFTEDKTPPIPVCDQTTTVTLSNNGWAHVFAESFDDGSHDNCTTVTFKVRRRTAGCGSNGLADELSNPFGPFVQVCCEDVGTDVMVELLVIDAYGNTNTCMIVTQAQDKVAPVILSCPASTTVNCSDAIVFGLPTFSDNCSATINTPPTVGSVNACGVGSYSKTWVVTDRGGRTVSCSQTITVKNGTPYNGPSSWPQSPREVNGCMNVDTDPSATGSPVLGNGACSQVAYTYEDQVFPFVDGVCFKILRKWTVIDWCKFGPAVNPNGGVYPSVPTVGINTWQFTQIIKVSETQKPELQVCSKIPTDIFGDNCTGYVELVNTAKDCTPSAQLRWTYSIDPGNDGLAPFITGTKNDASGTFPTGTHKITWTVEDMCGNQSTCMYTFEVRDRKKPTPYCLSDLTTVVMPTSGTIDIWAKDFDKGSSDNCSGPGTCPLRFTFNGFKPPISSSEVLFNSSGSVVGSWPTTNTTLLAGYESGLYQRWLPSTCSSAKLYVCANVGANEEDMTVWDLGGNSDFCTVTLRVQANGTACAGNRIGGDIGTEENKMVKDVQVTLQNMTNNETRSFQSSSQGHYEFAGMPVSQNYKVTPVKDNDYLNGVSTLDLVLMQRHILGLNKFNTAYKYIAGDITKDNKVTGADLVDLRKLILGIHAKFQTNTSWRFLDKSVIVADIENPWTTSEYINITNFNSTMMDNHFVAVKIGDINGSATANANNPSIESRSKRTLVLATQDKAYVTGEVVTMDITSDNFTNLVGAQLTLNFDGLSLDYTNISSGALKVGKENIHAQDGKISLSWNEFNGQTVAKDQVLFTIEFRATTNNTIGNTVKVSSDITKAEAYTHDLSELNVGLEIRNGKVSESIFALDQNNPNPFTSVTMIGFNLPTAAPAKLTIYDITGKIVKTIQGSYPKGRTEINISAEDINAQGVLFYELESNGVKATKKMIYLNK